MMEAHFYISLSCLPTYRKHSL